MTTLENQEQQFGRQEATMRTAEHSDDSRPVTFTGQFLSADEVGTLSALMQDLRDLTQSRRTFAAASDLLSRLTTENDHPHLVHDQMFEY